jgi:hypothetical protein
VIGVANSILTNKRAEGRRQIELVTRQEELFMEHGATNTYEGLKHWQDVMYRQDWKTWDEYWEKYSVRVNPEAAAKVMYIANIFQTLGVLVREKLIDSKFIYKQDPHSVVLTWNRLKPYVIGVRENLGYPKLYDGFEWLANLVTEMRKEESE